MKKITSIFIMVICFLALSTWTVNAEIEQDRKVASDKTWTVTFNTAIDLDSAKSAIQVVDQDGKDVALDVTYGKTDQKVKVNPEAGAYEEGQYTLKVGDAIQSVEGVQAADSVEMSFVVSDDAWNGWHSVRQLDGVGESGNQYQVHLLADEQAPSKSDSTLWYKNKYEGSFKFGLEKDGVKTISEEPVTDRDTVVFYQNDNVNLNNMVRTLDDQVFVVSQMDSATFTGDYYYAIKDGKIHPVEFQKDGDSFYEVVNTSSNLTHEQANVYVQTFHNNSYGKSFKTNYLFDHQNLTMTAQAALSTDSIQRKVDYLQDKVFNIMYTDLAEEANYGENRDYSRIEPKLDQYLTSQMNQQVKEDYYEACVQCDTLYYDYTLAWDLQTTVLENTENRVIVETVQPKDFSHAGSFVVLTMKKEGEYWKLDDITHETFSKHRHLTLTAEEAKQRVLDDKAVEEAEYLRTYQDTVSDYDGNEYTTNIYEFRLNSGEKVTVDASTGMVSL